MPKKTAPKAANLLGGGNKNFNTIPENGVKVHIPTSIIEKLEREIQGVNFGGVSLIVAIRDGHPSYRLEKTISLMATDSKERAV